MGSGKVVLRAPDRLRRRRPCPARRQTDPGRLEDVALLFAAHPSGPGWSRYVVFINMNTLRSTLHHVRGLRTFYSDRKPSGLLRAQRRTPIDDVLAGMGRARTFVQLGSNDGVSNDALYRHVLWGGWRGAVVEPMPGPFARLTRNYRWVSRVVPIQTAVGAVAGQLTMFYVEPRAGDPGYVDQISSFLKDHVLSHTDVPDVAGRVRERVVPVTTFADICERAGLSTVDVVHLDVEGFDAALLAVLPYDKLQIGAVIFEHLHMAEDERTAAATRLADLGYRLVGATDQDSMWSR